MKKLLLSTISLLLFSISILIFDISCQKESMAQTDTTPKALGILVFYDYATNGIWKCNYDGTNHTKINAVLPAGFEISTYGEVSVSPDATKIFFLAYDSNHTTGFGPYWICSINLDGTGFKKVSGHRMNLSFVSI